jgi:hypothetical protein
MPSIFYGSLTINGRPVPVGSVVTAKINDLTKGSFTVVTEGYCEQINVADGNPEDIITFYVQTPAMANQIQASETAVWISGKIDRLDLTFTGEEIAKTETTGNTGSAGGNTGNTGAQTNQGAQNTEVQNNEQIQGTVYNIDENFKTSNNVTLKISKNDEIVFTFENEQHSIKVKSMSDFAVLLTISSDPFDVIIGAKETKNVDLNGDSSDDISIKLNSIKENKADITITKLKKESPKTVAASTGINGVTGMAISTEAALGFAVLVIVVIAIAGLYLYRGRK